MEYFKESWKAYKDEIPSATQIFAHQSGAFLLSLKLSHLTLLMKTCNPPSVRSKISEILGACDRALPKFITADDFFTSLNAVMKKEYSRTEVDEFFSQMDVSGKGIVAWETFVVHMLQNYQQNFDRLCEKPQNLSFSQPTICYCTGSKKEPIIRVLAVSRSPSMHYVSISRKGALTAWSKNIINLKQVEVSSDQKIVGWTTDAVYMTNVQMVAMATISKGIHFFDLSTPSYFETLHLFGLSHAATALCFWYDTEAPAEKCLLMWGDDSGAVNLLWFLQPYKGLYKASLDHQGSSAHIQMKDIRAHSEFMSYECIPKIHKLPIKRIIYKPQTELIITSSESSVGSIVIIDIDQRREKYTWDIRKGVRCFDFSYSLSLLVTAGEDCVVRMWNRHETIFPIAALQGHNFTVVDVVIHQAQNKIFSYSVDSVLKVWDVSSKLCVMTLPLDFPNNRGDFTPQHGPFPLMLNLADDPVLLVTCREYLGLLELHKEEVDKYSGMYTCALYSSQHKQVITACTDSTIRVWDVKTGMKKMEIKNAHGIAGISCMVLDKRQCRLFSAAINGTIKVWNLLNGQILHKLEACDGEVTEVTCLNENQLLATGGSRMITQYNLTNEVHVNAELSWKSSQQCDSILVMVHCSELALLATGGYDGEIMLWNLILKKPKTQLQTPLHGTVRSPICKLLFLQRRVQQCDLSCSAVLLSSQAGCISWWNMHGPQHKQGDFYVPDDPDETVKALSTNQENSLLITGDSSGAIKIWDISQYALSAEDQPESELPPLLHFWKGHAGAVVSSEVLLYDSRFFVLSASLDQKAYLWTIEGGCVGCFGQKKQWNLTDLDIDELNRKSSSKEEERVLAEGFIRWAEASEVYLE